MSKKKRYAAGTSVRDYLENPATELQQNQIDLAQAKYEAASNPLTLGLKGLGQAGMAMGLQMGGFGSSMGGQIANQLIPVANSVLASGGQVNSIPVEVEGGEVGQLPSGQMMDFSGPNHESGGINTILPEGTEIYSKRIKVNGKTMAERKKKREKLLAMLQKRLAQRPSDAITKATNKRMGDNLDKEEQADKKLQELFKGVIDRQLAASEQQSMASGGTIQPLPTLGPMPGDYMNQLAIAGPHRQQHIQPIAPLPGLGDYMYEMQVTPPSVDQINTSLRSRLRDMGNQGRAALNQLGQEVNESPITPGDITSMLGVAYSGIAPYLQTLRNRGEDKPNENYYKDFGRQGLETLDSTRGALDQSRDKANSDLELSRQSAIRRNRNGARGVNTARSLDLATQLTTNRGKLDINERYNRAVMDLDTRVAAMQNQQDQMVMRGEAQRDLADRQDTDNYRTQLAQNKVGMGRAFQELGKDMNAISLNKELDYLINQMSIEGYKYDKKKGFYKE